MDINNKPIENDPYFDDVKTKTALSFDFVLWFYRILKYWYLFVISVAIFMACAYIKNKSWVPSFVTHSMFMLQDRGTSSIVAGSVPVGVLLKSTENQQTLLESKGMTEKTIASDSLPSRFRMDYYIHTRFKKISFYSDAPVEVEALELTNEAYNYEYTLTYVDKETCEISFKKHPEDPGTAIIAPYNQEIDELGFCKIKLKKTPHFHAELTDAFKPEIQSFNFRFLSDNELVRAYTKRLSTKLHDENGTILDITMVGPDHARDVDYMKTLLHEFQEYTLNLKNRQADQTLSFINKQLIHSADSLNSSSVRLRRFQEETGVYEQRSYLVRLDMDSAQREEETLYIQERELMYAAERIKESIESNTKLLDPYNMGVKNPNLTRYIEEYNELLKKNRGIMPKSILYNQRSAMLTDSRRQILNELISMQVNLQDRKDAYIRRYKSLGDKVKSLPVQEQDLVKYERDYRLNEMYYNYLRQKQVEAELQRSSNAADNEVFEKPESAGPINGNEITDNYIYFFLIGLAIPLVFVVLKEEVLNFSVTTKEECEKISGFPVIGTIENVAKKLSNGVVLVKNYPKSSFAESFRNMRVRIEYMAQRENKITVLVTSTEPADGKTFIATNIASVYQLMGKKVVIVDLDLRRPSVGKTLRLESTKGISNYLIGQVTLDEIIISHPDYGFDIIPAGTLPPNPSELIKTAKTKEVLAYLKEKYDYVIIDCSPVGLVSDAYILSEMADTTLFVVRRAKTNKAFFKSVIGQLKYDEVNNIALVFNDVKGREGYYGTSRYYGDKTYYLKKNSYYHDDYFEN